MHFQKKMKRQNIETAEQLGIMTEEKLKAGAPLSWKLVSGEEIDAIKALGLPLKPRMNTNIIGPIGLGWTDPRVYDMIIKFEELGEQYAGLTLQEWLSKTIGDSLK